jgi:hypothetical protein
MRASDDAWVILYDKNKWEQDGIPTNLESELSRLKSLNNTIRAIALGPSGSWVVIYNYTDGVIVRENGFTSYNAPDTLFTRLTDIKTRAQKIRTITIGPSGGWAVIENTNTPWSSNTPTDFFGRLTTLQNSGAQISQIALGTNNRWAIIANNNTNYSGNLSTTFFNNLEAIKNGGYTVNALGIGTGDSYGIVYNKNAYYGQAIR